MWYKRADNGRKKVIMASTKDKAVLEILYTNKEIYDLKQEMAELQEFIDYHKQVPVSDRTAKWYMAVNKVEEQLQSYKWDLQDLYEERKQEFTAGGFTEADFGKAKNNYEDAKWYSDLKSCPDCRPEFTNGDKCQKYRALNNEDIRHASLEQCKRYALQFFKSLENDKHDDWTDEEKTKFKENNGMTIEEWRAIQKPLFSKRVA